MLSLPPIIDIWFFSYSYKKIFSETLHRYSHSFVVTCMETCQTNYIFPDLVLFLVSTQNAKISFMYTFLEMCYSVIKGTSKS